MSTITNQQLYSEIEQIKRDVRQLQDAMWQFRVVQTPHPYIIKVEGVQGGEPITRNGYVTVRTIVEQTRLGATPEELVKGHPPLTLAEIYDALSYYHDHTNEIESIIAGHNAALERAKEFIARNVPPQAKTA